MVDESVKAALLKTMDALKKNPAMGRMVFRAETRLSKNVCCTANVRDFAPMLVDEPPELGGSNAAMNPVELLLVALGTCQEIMFAAYASVMGIALEEVKVDVKGHLDARGLFGLDHEVPAGYQRITYETTIKSSADEATLRQLIDAVEKHCPLLDTLTRSIPVSATAYNLNGSALPVARAA